MFLGKKMETNSANSRKNLNKKNFQKFEITNFKGKRLFLVNKHFKVIIIIPTLN
jgi:hypothetical protein